MEPMRRAYLGFIEDETNNKFDEDNLPRGVEIALDIMVELDPFEFDISSESIGDLSRSYESNADGIPMKAMRWLAPYYRIKSL